MKTLRESILGKGYNGTSASEALISKLVRELDALDCQKILSTASHTTVIKKVSGYKLLKEVFKNNVLSRGSNMAAVYNDPIYGQFWIQDDKGNSVDFSRKPNGALATYEHGAHPKAQYYELMGYLPAEAVDVLRNWILNPDL
jgi:hypothetical protein